MEVFLLGGIRMQQIKDVSTLTFTKARGGQFRWITISTLMLAIGTLLLTMPRINKDVEQLELFYI